MFRTNKPRERTLAACGLTLGALYRALSRKRLLACVLVCLAGCDQTPVPSTTNEGPQLGVAQPAEAEITDFVDYTGRTNAKISVTIVPRVTGYLVKSPFKEGADVKKGDLLFEIDPRPYRAQYEAALAQKEVAEANLTYQKATHLRFEELNKKQPGAVSQRELDQYKAQEEQAQASLKLANANVASAKLNLDWTKVVAPIDGRISRYFLTHGNIVNQDSTQLTTLVSMEPMYVYFDMDEPTLLKVKKLRSDERKGILPSVAVGMAGAMGSLTVALRLADVAVLQEEIGLNWPVEIKLQGESDYRWGTINFIDNQVNPGTDSISVRGVFPNNKLPGGGYELVPGMFVRVHLPVGQREKHLLVIDRAITSEQGKKYVYVVDAENKIKQRSVTTGSLQDEGPHIGQRVITSGLKKSDWVLVSGLQQVRPEMTIRPEKWKMPVMGGPLEPLTPPPAAPSEKKGKK